MLLVVGCSAGPVEQGATDSDAAQSASTSPTGTSPTSTSPTSESTQVTGDPDDASTATTATGGDSQGATDPASSDSVAQTGSGGGSSTGDPSTTGGAVSTGEPDTSTGACAAKDGPDPVSLGEPDDLGAAGAYVVLAKSAITNVPGTSITGGHLGVSPVAHTAITGFSLVLDPSGVFSVSPELAAPWKVYAADYAVPTPIRLTTAVLGMQAAYADAAARVPTDYLDVASGELGGLVLAPGIYTWGSTVLISDDVTLAGCEDDVWIFQISGDLEVSTGKAVLLAGDAGASNVFWQVGGQTTIHAGAHLEGVVLSQTGITLQTKASLHGRVYAQTMVAFDQNAVTAP